MKSLRDDSLPIDVTRDDPVHRPGNLFYLLQFLNLELIIPFLIYHFSSYQRRKTAVRSKQQLLHGREFR